MKLKGEVILGIGVDLIEVQRIEDAITRLGEPFLKRLFTPAEVAYAQTKKRPAIHLAARFAAKEAVSKAFGIGIGERLGWLDMEVIREESGQPGIRWLGKGIELIKNFQVERTHLSITHTDNYASAYVVITAAPG